MAKNMGESVNAKLRDVSRRLNTDMSTVQTRYALERLLYRLTQTSWHDKIALKGALIFLVHDGDIHRPTGDMDINGFVKDGNIEVMGDIVRDACRVQVDDGMDFKEETLLVRKDRDWASVPGGKIEMDAHLGTSRIRVRIDMGFGNVITPQARMADYPTILQGMPAPRVLVYPYETMLSEKLHAMVRHGAETTRLRDYYDIWSLTQRYDFSGEMMARAVRGTFNQAGDPLPVMSLDGLSEDFIRMRSTSWDTFRKARGFRFQAPNLTETVNCIRPFLETVVQAAHGEPVGDWKAAFGWSKPVPAFAPVRIPAFAD